MRQLLSSIVILLLSFGVYAQTAQIKDSEIIDRIIAKYSKIYEQIEGIELIKEVETNIYDSKSKKLLENKKIKFKVNDFFYKKGVAKVLEYYKDGKKEDPEDYKSGRQSEPLIPIFDKNSKENYNIKIIGSKKYRQVDCYKLKVIPKRKSETLFKGEMLVSKKTLSPIYLKGTVADFPNFVEDFQIIIDYKSEKFPSESEGEVTIHIDVPIFFSDKLIISKFKTFKSIPIKKR